MSALTRRQIEVFEFIIHHFIRHQRPPANTAFMRHFGWRTAGSPAYHLKGLEEKGCITRVPRVSCGIIINWRKARALGLPHPGPWHFPTEPPDWVTEGIGQHV